MDKQPEGGLPLRTVGVLQGFPINRSPSPDGIEECFEIKVLDWGRDCTLSQSNPIHS